MPKLATLKTCTGCMLCMNVCPNNAIQIKQVDGFLNPQIDKEHCIECKLCEHYCPVIGKSKINLISGGERTPYSVKSKNTARRIRSASGGFFMELAIHFFEKYKEKCYVVGAVIDGLEVRHIIINNKEDLLTLQGTKYLQSNVGFIYNSVYKLLKEGAFVLFSGLSCQIYALKKYLYNKKFIGDIIFCDLICNGVPSNRLLEIDIKNNIKDIKRIVSFRDKVDGWEQCLAFTYVNKDNNIVRLRGEVSFFLRAFRVNYALRNCCYNCSYCKMERAADFTIGDFWGGDLSEEDKKNGVSLTICHNEKAQNILFNISTIEYKKIDWNECLPNNPRIYCGRRFIQWIIPRKILKIIWKCNYKVQEQVLTDSLGVISKKRFYWIGLKIWRIVILKIEQIYRKAKLLSILRSM